MSAAREAPVSPKSTSDVDSEDKAARAEHSPAEQATAEQAPGLVLQGTLILREQQPPGREQIEQSAAFSPDRLPKLPKRKLEILNHIR